MVVFIEAGQIQCCVKCWLLCVHDACWIPQHFGLAWSSSASTMSSSVHSRPLWVADRVGRGNGVKNPPSTAVRYEWLMGLDAVIGWKFCRPLASAVSCWVKIALFSIPIFLYFSMFLYFSLFSLFFSIFLCPLKINFKIMFYFALFFSIFLWEPDGVSPR